ncbi:hypothetical protein F7R20_26825 [Pseudomonas brassicacearum subsp. brassicacearum]|nr:hypothetical protein F7R20_26825 [Pseudomonas brassicacearum subsp. brassicacearum]PJH86481.1 hypothetical protein CVG87_24460 [Pseudomonas sp. WCS365]QEO81063.1 hypothetical protein ELZ14_27285 [Pseudomonas brassicacearum]
MKRRGEYKAWGAGAGLACGGVSQLFIGWADAIASRLAPTVDLCQGAIPCGSELARDGGFSYAGESTAVRCC